MPEHPLTRYRIANHLKPADLARTLGVSRVTLHRWESGDRKIGRDRLKGVVDATGIPARDLRPDLTDLAELLTGDAA